MNLHDDKIKQIVEDIKKRIITQINPVSIIVFGSIAKGFGTNESDLDLFIVWNDNCNFTNVKRRIILRKIIGFTDIPVDIITCTSEELNKALEDKLSFTSKIVEEGEVIYGRLG